MKVSSILGLLIVALVFQPFTATAQQSTHDPASGFSFDVYGDSR